MNIKTWSQRITPESTVVAQLRAMQAEINELRAALQERDAEIEGWKADQKENLANQCNLQATIKAQRNVLEQALEALQTCRIRSVTEGEVREVTPKIITNAIIAIQEQLK